jgi:long-chain acyl-CoA synthetase
MTNLASNLVTTATEHGDRNAVRLDDHVLSYTDLHAGGAAQAPDGTGA